VRCELEVVSGRVMLRTDDEAHPDRWEAFECDARQLAELLRVRLDAENLAASAALARDKASVMEALRAVLIAWRAGRPWDERDDTVRSALAVHREQGGLPIGPAVRRPSLGGEGVGRG
jgi:DNA-binding FadR family transcriptional regulator